MAKEYFQDILPPGDAPKKVVAPATPTAPSDQSAPVEMGEESAQSRGIRSIQPPARPRPMNRVPPPARPLRAEGHIDGESEDFDAPTRKGFLRWWMWAIAAVALVVTAAVVILSTRPTTVSVVPKSRAITLSDTLLVAAPESAPIPGLPLTYSTHSFDLEDSEVIAAQGTRHVESKASGSITVFNEYSPAPVKLIKNTRFETSDGLVFRAPADVVVPGKSGATAGQVKVTVVADQAGEKYNIGPVARFTLPGLKSGDMYTKVYARSTLPMTGGIVGDEPATAPGALTTAISAVRSRLAAKAQETVLAQSESSDAVIFPGLAQIAYVSLPNTAEGSSTVRIHQKAHVEVPMFAKDMFAVTIAQAQSEDVQLGQVRFAAAEDFGARAASSSLISYGTEPVSFLISGAAQLVWNIDSAALSAALAGRETGAFQTIVDGFAGIQEARARIVPPWKKVFPTDAERIKVVVQEVLTQ